MLNRLPKDLPSINTILDDLGHPSVETLSKALDVSPRTMKRWLDADKMPRTAQLALFWLTRWGSSIIDCNAVNDARLYASLARCYADENRKLSRELARVLSIGNFGCANSPLAIDYPGIDRLPRLITAA